MNCSLFRSGTPPVEERVPTGLLAAAIERDFGSLASLRARFAEMVEELTGAGWVWLVSSQDQGGTLQVLSTGPHVLPLRQGYDVLLQRHVAGPARPWIDLHARAAALDAWWCLVNWAQVGRRYEHTSRLHPGRWNC
jgi:Fe-Mn family superoxide dismutase